MSEIELKFSIPAARAKRVATEARRGSDSLALEAVYFDTEDRALAGAGVSLRLRNEGGRWVQTAKAPGSSSADREEHEAPRTAASLKGARFMPDLALHDGTPAGDAVRQALGERRLQEVFRTEGVRHRRMVQAAGAQIELAIDEGEIVAGDRRQPVQEMEFELKAGSAAGLFALARRWIKRHGLWLEGRSKAERGHGLSLGESGAPPRKSQMAKRDAIAIKQASDEQALLRALVNASLRQVVANAGEVAAGRGTPDHVHQLRVGLRRLRTALRAFGDGAPELAECEAPLAEVFRQLGALRDPAVTRESIIPRLREAGAPMVELPVTQDERISPVPLVRDTSFQLALLALMEFGMDVPQEVGGEEVREPLDAAIAKRLAKLHKQVRRDGSRFERLPLEEQHEVRKRLKRLRYLAEFVAPRFKARAVKRYLAALEPAQDALGSHNDAVVAMESFRAAADENPAAWFAVGWLTARLDESAARARRALKAIEDQKCFWR